MMMMDGFDDGAYRRRRLQGWNMEVCCDSDMRWQGRQTNIGNGKWKFGGRYDDPGTLLLNLFILGVQEKEKKEKRGENKVQDRRALIVRKQPS